MKQWIMVTACIALGVLLASSCKNNPVENNPEDIPKDTSIFIGTWAEVFDTSDVPAGMKDQKMRYWFNGIDFNEPDTMRFVNDTMIMGKNGFETCYYYSSDSIYSYLAVDGKSDPFNVSSYYLSNDTLIFDPDDSVYVPVYLKVH